MKNAIVLAAGKGTRMHSDEPKVLHRILEMPMAELIVRTLRKAGAERIITVTGFGHEKVEKALDGLSEFALQETQLGSGHAVMMVDQLKEDKGLTLVVNGDTPCIRPETLSALYQEAEHCDMAVLTVCLDRPGSYGRIIRHSDGQISRIAEFKDCTPEEAAVKEVNTGIYAFKNEILFRYLPYLKAENAQKEYYITDLVDILNRNGCSVHAVCSDDPEEVQGVNDPLELAAAGAALQKRINRAWMKAGVVMMDPQSAYIGPLVQLDTDVVLHPNVYLYGDTRIGSHTVIMPQTFLRNAVIGEHCLINASEITDSRVGNHCEVGPYAHLRMNTVVDDRNRIGNFVEFKNTRFGFDSRCAHLTYLGDSDVGRQVNIGCGVITVNYDGASKFHTVIKDGAFIGSNANLIAPVTIGENAVVAAGSTITENVADTDMGIARAHQENKPGFGKVYLDRNRSNKK